MSRATPQMRSLARHLIGQERPASRLSAAENPAAFDVIDKLRPHLATLMGNIGFRALLSRALALANEEVSWLRAVHVKADGSLEGLAELHAQLDPAVFLQGRIVLLAQLLGLLVAFIGKSLTSRVLAEIWPHISLDDMDFGEEADHEKAR
jgi:hypothetical protein